MDFEYQTAVGVTLPAGVNQALSALGFKQPTPIQQKAIPIAVRGGDLIGCAQTGTGKTAAFCIPALLNLLKVPGSTALVLVPTRELAQQIDAFWKDLTRFTRDARNVVLIGGVSMQPQLRSLSRDRPRLIIATPGRLIDHLNRRSLTLARTAMLVLDEADRMLDMGFAPQLKQILRYLPTERQTMLFSATWNQETDGLSRAYLHNPERVSVGQTSRAAVTISQSLVHTTAAKKNETLLDELNRREGQILVFTRTKSRTDRVARYLASFGVEVNRIHGGRTQGQRNQALNGFRDGDIRVLVATDIAARGIDVASIAHVINYDLPQVAEDYVHRIGRTGRAGAVGQAVSLLTPEDRSQWREVTKLLQRTGSALPTPRAV